MKAKLLKDHIGIGSGLTHLSDTSDMTENARRMRQMMIDEYNRRADSKLKAYDRRYSIPAQTVEVLDIYDQAEYADLFKTPTWSEIVAKVRAQNFDGETVETVVSVSALDIGAHLQQNSAENILQAARNWLKGKDK